MEILLNPNIAYLFLVAGLMLAAMAVLSPGTGILELLGIVFLLLAGWEMINLEINPWALVVLLVGAVLFIMAIRWPKNRAYLLLSLVAIIAGSAFLFRVPGSWQPAVNPFLAVFVSLLSGGFIWIATRKVLETRLTQPTHDLEHLIGATGEAKTDIDDEGSVLINSELWSAHSKEPIAIGARVRVVAREGYSLEVEKVDQNRTLASQ